MDASFGFDPGRGIDEKFGVGSPELRFSPKGDKGGSCAGDVLKRYIKLSLWIYPLTINGIP